MATRCAKTRLDGRESGAHRGSGGRQGLRPDLDAKFYRFDAILGDTLDNVPGMSEAGRFIALLRMPIGERAVLVLTFALTILVDLTVAIGVGVTLASLLFMARMSEASGVIRRPMPL